MFYPPSSKINEQGIIVITKITVAETKFMHGRVSTTKIQTRTFI
jgi:hypothetical protein